MTTLFPAYQTGPVHRHIAGKLEYFVRDVEAGKSPRLMITVPPRHGKSELGSVFFPAWVLGERPDWPILHCSYTAELSNGFSRRVRNLIKEPAYEAMYPGVTLSRDSRSVTHWNLAAPHRGEFTSAGVGGPITGRGGKVVIIDDPVKNRQDADSELFRKTQREWYSSTLYTRLEGVESGIVLILTRWHTDDLGGYVTSGAGSDEKPADAERWEIVNLPAVCEREGDPLGRAVGEALWPEKFPLSYLDNIRDTQLARDWTALYQQSPVAPEGNMLHPARIRAHHGKIPKALHVVCGWDLAISEKETADYRVGAVVGIDPANLDLYLLDLVRGRWDFNATLAQMDALARRWGPLVVGIEDVAYQAAALQEGRRRYLHPFMGVKVTRDKVARAMLFADRIDAGKVYADRDAPWWTAFQDEAMAFPTGSFDDQIDAISVALEAYSGMQSWRVA